MAEQVVIAWEARIVEGMIKRTKKKTEDEEGKELNSSSGRKSGFKGTKKLSANQRRAAAEKEAKEKRG
jgi:hypothetical protein